jgi:5-deoxy-glucuronate isomerase
MDNKKKIYFTGKKGAASKALIINPLNSPLKTIKFIFFKVSKYKKKVFALKKRETILVLLSGEVEVNGTHLGPRKNVFSAKSHSLYLRGFSRLEVTSLSDDSECILVSSLVEVQDNVVIPIPPRKVSVKVVGKESYLRTVHTIFKAQQNDIDSHLIVGETFNEPGKWSSFPPHRHAVENPPHETRFEEVYFFKVEPQTSFGFIRVYDSLHDETVCIKNNDSIIVTDGYHPVCAMPETKLYYFWVLFGKSSDVINTFDKTFCK